MQHYLVTVFHALPTCEEIALAGQEKNGYSFCPVFFLSQFLTPKKKQSSANKRDFSFATSEAFSFTFRLKKFIYVLLRQS